MSEIPGHMNGPRRIGLGAPFFAGLVTLLVAGGLLQYARASGRLYLKKEKVPLVRELDQMRTDCVAPYIVRDRTVLSDETVYELGTKQYAQWIIENPNSRGSMWQRSASMFVTYYTGVQDQVPHVPEECYYQGNASPAGSRDIDFSLPGGRVYPVRRLSFLPPRGNGTRVFVYYTFIVNGDMVCDRNQVRSRMGRESERYLYYSKIELCFQSLADEEAPPDMDRMAERLLGQIIPVLLKDHIPDVAALERQAAAGGS